LKDIILNEFQYSVSDLLIRNKSILDLITKFQDSNSKVNRSIIKSATQCGCITINAEKQRFYENSNLEEIGSLMSTHVDGCLCENCRDFIEKEIGENLFYLASLCNTLDLNLYDIILKEHKNLKLLGKFSLR
jgi:hypothetical protein